MTPIPEFIPRELTPNELVSVMFEYSSRIAAADTVDEILIEMNNMARQLVVADRCTLWLVDSEKNKFWTRVLHGVDERLEIPLESGMVGEVYKKAETIIIDDAYQSPYFNSDVDQKTGYHTRNALMVPLLGAQGEVMGVYQAINKFENFNGLIEAREFTEKDAERLKMAATFFGKSLESQLLFEEVEKTQRDLLHMLGEVAESRSKETGNHVLRVGEYSWILAKALGLPEDECEVIRLAAPLHDIGKVAITDLILNKPGKLTEDEFEIMKTHAKIGEDLLSRSPRKILQAGSIIAGQHQEKFNGRGYPRALSGREEEKQDGTGIHLYGRICAVADVFDALAHDRCYKSAWPMERIRALFEDEKGSHFDPILVDILFDKWNDFLDVHHRFNDIFE